jgi:cell wall-associated NlpC family hydrolase
MIKHSDLNWAGFVELGKKLVGKPYKMGAELNLGDLNTDHIKAIDCSELTEYLFANLKKIDGTRAELNLPDGSYNQAKVCKHVDRNMPLIGDLVFKWWPDTQVIHHAGVFIGDEKILEAKGLAYGVILSDVEKYVNNHFAFWGRHPKIEDA